jgi:hypothetical protein
MFNRIKDLQKPQTPSTQKSCAKESTTRKIDRLIVSNWGLYFRSKVYNYSMQKTLIIVGVVLVLVGALWPWVSQVPIGRLPGDLVIKRPNFTLYFPITSMLLISVLLNLLFRLFKH